MRVFTKAELKLAPKVAEVMGEKYLDEADVYHRLENNTYLPTPLEHDCLEWLRGRGFYIEVAIATYVRIFISKGDIIHERRGKETLEALYRCIIEVGE